MRGMLRGADTVARLGGDEFAVVLPVTDVDGALLTAQKVLHEIEQPCVIDHRALSVRASLGIACFPDHGRSAGTLLERADVAMYVAKSDGVGIAVYAPDQDHHAHRRLTLVAELRNGLSENQFHLEYQPIVQPADQRRHRRGGAGALEPPAAGARDARRVHPPRRADRPDQSAHDDRPRDGDPRMEPAADDAAADGRRQPVAADAAGSRACRAGSPTCSRSTACRRESLALEITENILMSDPARSMDCLNRLHDMGVRIVIDDFGTGYSSLSYLRRLPVDELKIDRSFIAGLLDRAGRRRSCGRRSIWRTTSG